MDRRPEPAAGRIARPTVLRCYGVGQTCTEMRAARAARSGSGLRSDCADIRAPGQTARGVPRSSRSIGGGRDPPGSRSLLDVGAGDGTRAARIARDAGLRQVTLLEPSARMRSYHPANATVWAMRAQDLHSQQGPFDVITCLWNVLGHILPSAARVEVLRQIARMVSPQGMIFIDVNHRYNARHYGAFATAMRFLRDRVSPVGSHGDVRVVWDVEGRPCATTGHVFTHPGVQRLGPCRRSAHREAVRDRLRFGSNSAGGVLKATLCMCCGAHSLPQSRANLRDFAVRQPVEKRQRQRS